MLAIGYWYTLIFSKIQYLPLYTIPLYTIMRVGENSSPTTTFQDTFLLLVWIVIVFTPG